MLVRLPPKMATSGISRVVTSNALSLLRQTVIRCWCCTHFFSTFSLQFRVFTRVIQQQVASSTWNVSKLLYGEMLACLANFALAVAGDAKIWS